MSPARRALLLGTACASLVALAGAAGAQQGGLADGFYLVANEDGDGIAWVPYWSRDDFELVSVELLMPLIEVTSVRPDIDKVTELPTLQFALTDVGAARLGQVTAEHVGDRLAVILEGRILTAPRINEQIKGEFQITGSFTEAEAAALARRLSPAPR